MGIANIGSQLHQNDKDFGLIAPPCQDINGEFFFFFFLKKMVKGHFLEVTTNFVTTCTFIK